MSGFAHAQIKKLVRSLDPAKIRVREAEGKQLRYIEGWFAIQEANAIFGFAGWDRQMVHCEKLYERARGNRTALAYSARVRIRVRAGNDLIIREGTGFGTACETDLAQAHERALKGAETDATKRALATFGNRFGLALYEKEQNGAPPLVNRFALRGSDGALIAQAVSAEGFCSGLRQLVEACAGTAELLALRLHNKAMIEALRKDAPSLKSARGLHYADILQSLIVKRLLLFEAKERTGAFTTATAPAAEVSSSASVQTSPAVSPQIPLANSAMRIDGSEPSAEASDNLALANQDKILAGAHSSLLHGQHDGSPILPVSTKPGSSKLPEGISHPSRIGQGHAVEKSQLTIASDRRIRNKAHLVYVASEPCLICEEIPCHAHHVTFAQRRGLSQKVSDEFTVPLCALHHNEVHLSGAERAWWRKQGIDPLQVAVALWAESLNRALAAFGDP